MKQSRWPLVGGIATLALLGGSLGGLNLVWARQASYPIYGYVTDLCVLAVMIFVIFRMRRWRAENSDEFLVAKKRFAAQTGFIFGFVIYAVSNALPLFFPEASNAFLDQLDGAREGFIIGRVFDMAPFVIGLLIGQVVSWVRYR